MGFDEGTKDLNLQKAGAKDFNFRDINPDTLLINFKYRELYDREGTRQDELNRNKELDGEAFWVELRKIDDENDKDERQTLNEYELQEFRYYTKFRSLEDERENLDPGMYVIMREFNRLPFITHQSCTGHVDGKSGVLAEDFFPAIVFTSGKEPDPSESGAQVNFLENVPDLCLRICNKIGISPYNILDLRGFLPEEGEELTVAETLERGLEITLYVNIDSRIPNDPKETLSVIWQETLAFIGEHTGKATEPFNIKSEGMFVKKSDQAGNGL